MRSRLAVILVLVSVFGAGCATIFNGRDSDVAFDTDPDGIRISTTDDGRKITCKTPCTLSLKNSEAHVLKFTHPDYRDETRHVGRTVSAWFWVNIVWGLPGLALMGVDYYTGSMWTVDRDSVFLQYEGEEEEDEEEEQQEESEEDSEEERDEEQPAVAEATAPGPMPEIDNDPTGIGAWPDPPPEVLADLVARYPEANMDATLAQYYGAVAVDKRAEIKKRVYRALYHQLRTSGETDLDLAISLERHDATR